MVKCGLFCLWLDGWPDEKRKMHLWIPGQGVEYGQDKTY